MNRFALGFVLLACAAAPAAAFNPQPDPPGRSHVELNPQPEPPGRAIRLADGSPALIGTDRRVSHIVGGKRVFLPPGPCRLQNGTVLTIGADGKVTTAPAHP